MERMLFISLNDFTSHTLCPFMIHWLGKTHDTWYAVTWIVLLHSDALNGFWVGGPSIWLLVVGPVPHLIHRKLFAVFVALWLKCCASDRVALSPRKAAGFYSGCVKCEARRGNWAAVPIYSHPTCISATIRQQCITFCIALIFSKIFWFKFDMYYKLFLAWVLLGFLHCVQKLVT